MTTRLSNFLVNEWWKVVVPLGVLAACIAAGYMIRRFLFRWIRNWSARSGHSLDLIIIPTLRRPIIIWAFIAGLDLATRTSTLPSKYARPIDMVLLALWTISLTIMAAQLSGNLVRSYGSRATGEVVSSTISKNVVQIVVGLIGFLVLLNQLHVDIRPMLTALGVGGLAVALALQDTLANLFSGFYISVSNQTRIGDYIKLNTGEEGYVTDITWRSTTLRTLGNSYVFIPNSTLSKAVVTNHNLPTKSMGLNINVRVPYDCDPDRVERILIEEAMSGDPIKGMVRDPAPNVSWNPGFGESSLSLSLNYQAEEFVNQYGIQSELRKRIFKRFEREGIPIAYPTQVVYQNESPPPSGAG